MEIGCDDPEFFISVGFRTTLCTYTQYQKNNLDMIIKTRGSGPRNDHFLKCFFAKKMDKYNILFLFFFKISKFVHVLGFIYFT